MEKRIGYLDILKMIAIFLVCSCHFLIYNDAPADNFFAVLSCGGVPLFFIVNGALLMNRSFDMKKHWRRTGGLYVTLLIWKIITPILEQPAVEMNIRSLPKAQFFQYFFDDTLGDFVVGHFWFMHALIGIYLIFPMIAVCYKNKKTKNYIYVLAVILYVFTIVSTDINTLFDMLSKYFGMNTVTVNGMNSYNPFGYYGYCLFYFILGGILFEAVQEKRIKTHRLLDILLIAVGWVWLFGLNRYQNSYTNARWIVVDGYQRTAVVFLTVGIFFLAVRLNQHITIKYVKKALYTVSDNTMGIYYTHVIVGTYYLKLYNQYIASYGVVQNCIKALILMVIGIVISLTMKKIPVVRRLFK